jgi:hypothetical protein
MLPTGMLFLLWNEKKKIVLGDQSKEVLGGMLICVWIVGTAVVVFLKHPH